ncbi:GTP cyclohydrolase II [Dimargaris cristalligena]|nr:GTP cyclohydrolase II [Dimargaris cristalligena]
MVPHQANPHCCCDSPAGSDNSLTHILPKLLESMNQTTDSLGELAAPVEIPLLTPPELARTPSATSSLPSSTSPTATATRADPVRVWCEVRARIPYPDGQFYLYLYRNSADQKEHLAIMFGDDIDSLSLNEARADETEADRLIRGAKPRPNPEAGSLAHSGSPSSEILEADGDDAFTGPAPLVRIHSECFTGETVSSVRCDCGYQLAEAMRLMQIERRGVVIYLRQEGRGIGLMDKLRAYNLQDMGHDTVTANLMLNHPADARNYDVAYAMLRDLELNRIRLLTNNPDKIQQIQDAGILVDERVPMIPRWWNDTPGALDDMDQELLVDSSGDISPRPSPQFNSGLDSPADALELASLRLTEDTKQAPQTPLSAFELASVTPTNSLPKELNRFASVTSLNSASSNVSSPSTLIWPLSPGDGVHSHLSSSKHLYPLPNQTQQPRRAGATFSNPNSAPRSAQPGSPATPSSASRVMAEANRYLQVKVQRMGHLLDLPRSHSGILPTTNSAKRMGTEATSLPGAPLAKTKSDACLTQGAGALSIRTHGLAPPANPSLTSNS